MPDPMQIPHELRLMIINYAADQGHERGWTRYKTKLRVLSNLSLVSKWWYAVLNEQIYSAWEYDCDISSISSLWKFLRTILSNRETADTVRKIHYSSFRFNDGLHFYAVKPPTFSQGDRNMIRDAICTAGVVQIKPDVMNAINNADPRSLLALLLANLQKLQTLHARLPHTDEFLAGVFREAVRHQPPSPLHDLSEVHLECNPWACHECRRPQYVHASLLWPIFQLPAIRRVSVSDFKPHEGASPADYAEDLGDILEASTVTDLHLNLNAARDPCLATPNSFILFSLPKRLTRLSISLSGRRFQSPTISNIEIWNAIRPHEGSIEYLDVIRHDDNNKEDDSKLGSLRGFKRLQRLYIQPELLSGKNSLGDDLPPNCQSLNFYRDDGFDIKEAFSQQLQSFISRAHLHAPNLWHIVLEKWRFGYSPAPPIYDQVENACKKYGIKFETKDLHRFKEGPRNW